MRDREQIVNAANRMTTVRVDDYLGLCWAFWNDAWPIGSDPFAEVPEYLRRLGGHADRSMYFWPLDNEGHAQRLTFLAFMLAWLDDIEASTPSKRQHP